MNIYETARLVDEYLLFHYGAAPDILPPEAPLGQEAALDFARRTVWENVPASYRAERALDIGCAVGRSAFELSQIAEEVLGIDFSHAFIDVAQKLQRGESVRYQRKDEGHLHTTLVASVPVEAWRERVRFAQGDAMALCDEIGTFDLVHAANLICRLPDPRRFLNRLPHLVCPNGLLILTTPCTWLGEFTPPENWPPGQTLTWLKEALRPTFDLTQVRSQPFLIRETARKYQWTSAEASVWRRRG